MPSEPIKTVKFEIPAPEYINLLEPTARDQLILEIQNEVRGELTRLFEHTAHTVVTPKFNMSTPKELLKKGRY